MLFATGISDRASSGVSGEPWPVAIAMSQAWPADASRAAAPAASAGAIGPCGSGGVTCAASPLALPAGPDPPRADSATPTATAPAPAPAPTHRPHGLHRPRRLVSASDVRPTRGASPTIRTGPMFHRTVGNRPNVPSVRPFQALRPATDRAQGQPPWSRVFGCSG